MTLSNQSHFPRFFRPRQMTYRGLSNSGLRQAGIACPRKMTLGSWLHKILCSDLARWLTGDKPIPACHKPESSRSRQVIFRDLVTPEDNLPGLGQFRPLTSRNWLGRGKSSSVISPFSASHLPEFLGWEECSGRFLTRVQRSSFRVQRSSGRAQRSSGKWYKWNKKIKNKNFKFFNNNRMGTKIL